MRVAIKICGISTPDALDAAIAAHADHAGFVFFGPSPRNVDRQAAARLAARAGSAIGKVGLFVDPEDGLLAESVSAGALDAIQLHGSETPERVAQVRIRFELPVWKAIAVSTQADVARAERYREVADLILFDARTPKDAALPGGMGLRFDWALLAGHRDRSGWGLAGGLTPLNVADAIAQTQPPLVDTSSGVESAPGVKDVDKIAAFCKAARSV